MKLYTRILCLWVVAIAFFWRDTASQGICGRMRRVFMTMAFLQGLRTGRATLPGTVDQVLGAPSTDMQMIEPMPVSMPMYMATPAPPKHQVKFIVHKIPHPVMFPVPAPYRVPWRIKENHEKKKNIIYIHHGKGPPLVEVQDYKPSEPPKPETSSEDSGQKQVSDHSHEQTKHQDPDIVYIHHGKAVPIVQIKSKLKHKKPRNKPSHDTGLLVESYSQEYSDEDLKMIEVPDIHHGEGQEDHGYESVEDYVEYDKRHDTQNSNKPSERRNKNEKPYIQRHQNGARQTDHSYNVNNNHPSDTKPQVTYYTNTNRERHDKHKTVGNGKAENVRTDEYGGYKFSKNSGEKEKSQVRRGRITLITKYNPRHVR